MGALAIYQSFPHYFICPSFCVNLYYLPLSLYSPPFQRAVLKLALVQMAVSANKSENLSRAVRMIGEAAQAGAKIVTLPVSIDESHYPFDAAEFANASCNYKRQLLIIGFCCYG